MAKDNGRPPKYKTAEDMQIGIDEYFVDCDTNDKPYTVAGLAYFLGFQDRHSISEYAEKDKFTATIKRAKLKIEMQRSESLVKGVGNVTGMIFDLKNNYGWRDKTEIDNTSSDGSMSPPQVIEIVAKD